MQQSFPKIFTLLTGLPPEREVDHSIVLTTGAQLVNLRPYCYSFIQKDEVEKMVREMLDAELIQPSHSPFASLVLLVKNKDAGWRFCVDYRALNKLTDANRYPIPVVKDLLDELGAKFVSNHDIT